jgi:hypothetical protein
VAEGAGGLSLRRRGTSDDSQPASGLELPNRPLDKPVSILGPDGKPLSTVNPPEADAGDQPGQTEAPAPDTTARLAEINRVRDRVVMADQQAALSGDTAARTRIETAETTAKRQSTGLLRSASTAELEAMLGPEAHDSPTHTLSHPRPSNSDD